MQRHDAHAEAKITCARLSLCSSSEDLRPSRFSSSLAACGMQEVVRVRDMRKVLQVVHRVQRRMHQLQQ